MTQDETIIYNEAKKYVDFSIEGKNIDVPYFMNGEGRYTLGVTDGKGSYEELKQELYAVAKESGLDLKDIDGNTITQLMQERGLGIDCSGYVYNILDAYFINVYRNLLSDYIIKYKGLCGILEQKIFRTKRVRKINADILTGNLNTIEIPYVKDIQVGDMIRLTPVGYMGKHVAIVVKVRKNEIIYAHSSEYTEFKGPHFSSITILDYNKNLSFQKRNENLQDGTNYGDCCYKVTEGDSVRRLKYLL